MTEALVYEAMFALGQRASAGKDRTRLNDLAAQTQANVLKHGVNLQQLRLTRSGFCVGAARRPPDNHAHQCNPSAGLPSG